MQAGGKCGLEFQPAPLIVWRHLLGDFDFTVALAAINGFAVPRFKRNLGGFAAIRTDCRIHLAWDVTGIVVGGVAGVAVSLGFPGRAARWATLGIVHETLGLVKFLFCSTELEVRSTIATRNCFGLKTHR